MTPKKHATAGDFRRPEKRPTRRIGVMYLVFPRNTEMVSEIKGLVGGGASLAYTARTGKFPARREFTGNSPCIAQATQPIAMTRCVIALPPPYFAAMIKTFRSDETQKVWEGQRSRRLPSDIQQVARRKLRMLNNARTLDDLRVPPGNRLEPLGGDRAGQDSIRINDQWRIRFAWQDGNAVDVEIVDYHGGDGP